MNKKKIINDPVYGFVSIPNEFIYDLLHHPYFQRLRRIKQLGLTEYVYPGALHTRFNHAVGAMHLMGVTIDSLRKKGQEISKEEKNGALAAILLHDIGHGPFSHALESSILEGVHHEHLSLMLMQKINKELGGELDLALKIFTGRYERKFFHQLVSSQLDMDRLDYIQRDCYFTGVSEGMIGADRIIRMLDVHNDSVVVEEKGIYSVENFLNTRRLMYWQVYLHKTTVSTEQMLIRIIQRARELKKNGEELFCVPALEVFLKNEVSVAHFKENEQYMDAFAQLDDYDIWCCIKQWTKSKDMILRELSEMILFRKLFRIHISNDDFTEDQVKKVKNAIKGMYDLKGKEAKHMFSYGSVTNAAYVSKGQSINILTKAGEVVDVAQASDLPNIKALGKIVKKYFLSYPKTVQVDL